MDIESNTRKTGQQTRPRVRKRTRVASTARRSLAPMMPPMEMEESFELPAWVDCLWRRVACGRDNCHICGRIECDRQKYTDLGEDPDNPQVLMEVLTETIREVVATMRKIARETHIELSDLNDVDEESDFPEPEAFPLYRDVWAWREDVDRATNEAELNGAFWPYTEDAEDLSWYKNTLCAKVYRQLCNRWRMDRGDENAWMDYEYTHRVLHECCELLRRALTRIATPGDPLRHTASAVLKRLYQLEQDVLAI